MKKLVVLSIAATLAGLASTASAEPKHTVEVKLGPAELANSQTAYKKLVKAARNECITPGHKSITTKISENRCYRELIAELVEKVGNNDVAALHTAATTKSLTK